MNESRPSMTSDTRIALGDAMWRELADTFRKVLIANNITDGDDRMQVWLAFLASQAGSMCADVGRSRASAVLRMLLDQVQEMSANDAGIVVVHGPGGPAVN